MADKNGDGTLDFDEVLKLLKVLNADVKKKYAREMFDAADTNKNGRGNNSVLDREEFVNFYHKLTKRVEVEEVFLRFSRGKGFMTLKDVLTFLREGQKMHDASTEDCRNILDHFETDKGLKLREHMSADAFRKLITSERQQLFNPAHKIVYQDMTRPMTHYFVDSSHNTYLAEDQLKGPSKVEMYIEALQKGCRCVELDCWDGSDGEPVIYHGHTLTSKIRFDDVIKAVNSYAFETSAYPVTLSLENHCSIEQQTVMARIMTSILGDKIWSPQEDPIHIPSPEELKFKIIIKGKKLPKAAEEVNDYDVSDEDEAADMPNNEAANSSSFDDNNSNNNNNNNQQSEEKRKASIAEAKKIKLDRQLSVITSMKSVGLKSVENNPEPVQFFSVISIGESKAEKMVQSNPINLNTISQHRLIRTYPSGTRTDSSNYNPVPMWNHGCQIVALNYQTPGEAMQLNHGRFMDNGGSGYVLKPDFLISNEQFGLVTGSIKREAKKNLKITIISGFQIPKPNDSTKGEVIDPFVKVELHGVAADYNDFKTSVIENNGFNPRWYETCVFSISVPELAILRFTVIDQDRARDDFIGYYSLPVMSVQQGFRHFPLFDKHGNQFKQSLIFTHITLTDA
ncbi:1-phosphatidylinositol 4,5-bisphosphate phosphodiesterase delta-4 [Plakobranchus ocellatus]|uniref:Phosphoinositide phospholipase C n=2 Tax=Plakobranchus ocellatus TaxID=259542 RepID=A0AAV4DCE0_9GAST|nr:1-phosphatidylinositol 4,5-bisphosphate phosphodiesterase delta-4 [Plakobranchus ocellatus]